MNHITRACSGWLLVMSVGQLVIAAEQRGAKQYSEKQLAQQQRMTDCSAEAKDKAMKGADRKAFMKTCLSGGSVTVIVGDEAGSAPEARGEEPER